MFLVDQYPRETLIFFMRKPSARCCWFYLTLFFSFSFFLLSLFAPLNGIQQLEDTSDTHHSGSFYLPFLCPMGTNFLCDTALPSWPFWLGTLAYFYYREFKTNNWWEHSSRHFHSSQLKPIQTTSVICTRTSSNLFAKRIVIPFCKCELHA